MNVETERIYVIRMSRLEAARTLVDPKELFDQLRASLAPDESDVIEGRAVVRALPAGSGGSSPRVKKLMRKFRHGSRRVQCPHCEKMVKPGAGLSIHLSLMHGGKSREAAA